MNRASRSAAQAAYDAAITHTACLCKNGELRTHLHQQERRGHAEGHHVAQAVQLGPELAGRLRQPGDVAVQGVEDHRQENQPAAEHAVARVGRQGSTLPAIVGVGTRDAITMAKNPHTRFPSVNIVGKMAMVRMGRMGRRS